MSSIKFYTIFIFTFVWGIIASTVLLSQNREIEEQKAKIVQIEKDIKFLDTQIVQTQKQHKNSLDELILVRKKISNRKELISQLDKQISLQEQEIQKKNREINALEDRLDTLSHYYKHLIINSYKNRDTRVWFMYILASNSIEQGYRRWNYLRNYSQNINNQAEKIEELKNELLLKRAETSRLLNSTILEKGERKKEYDLLQQEERLANSVVSSLAGKKREYEKQLSQKKKESQRLNKEVERLIQQAIKEEQERLERERRAREEAKKRGDTSKPKVTLSQQESEKLTGSFSANKGKLPWPVNGVVIEKFGENNHPTLKGVKLPFNNGINISTQKNAQVRAVFDGLVKQIIAIPGYNQCVLVQHGTYFTFYTKLEEVNVDVGERVELGTVIGSLVADKNTSVLHFELWNGTTKQNPQLWLKKR